MEFGFEILIVLLLIVLNGLFSLSELALISSRRARLLVMERKGVAGATTARLLAEARRTGPWSSIEVRAVTSRS